MRIFQPTFGQILVSAAYHKPRSYYVDEFYIHLKGREDQSLSPEPGVNHFRLFRQSGKHLYLEEREWERHVPVKAVEPLLRKMMQNVSLKDWKDLRKRKSPPISLLKETFPNVTLENCNGEQYYACFAAALWSMGDHLGLLPGLEQKPWLERALLGTIRYIRGIVD